MDTIRKLIIYYIKNCLMFPTFMSPQILDFKRSTRFSDFDQKHDISINLLFVQ